MERSNQTNGEVSVQTRSLFTRWMTSLARSLSATLSAASRANLWMAVGLIFVFWLSRLLGIGVFPPFLDEAGHVHYAQMGFRYSGVYGSDARLFSIWWYILFQPRAAEAIWILRVATLLSILPGFAALIAFGKLAAGRWGAILVGLFYLFSTYHTFFDRIALTDSVASSGISVAIYLGYRLSHRAHLETALLTGAVIFLAIGAKTSVLPYLILPAIAALTVKTSGRAWRANLRWGAVALGSAVILIGLLALGMWLFKYNFFGLIATHNRESTGLSAAEIITHAQGTLALVIGYVGPVVLGFLLLCVLILAIKRRFYLVLCLVAPLLVLWANQSQFSRFFIPAVTILLLCGAVTLADFLRTQRRLIQVGGLGLVLVYGLVQWLPFAWTAANQPTSLALSPVDRKEYIRSDASGFGLAEVHSALQQSGAHEVIGLFSNCANLQLMTPPSMKITCPVLNPDGSSVRGVLQLVEENRHPGVYVVLEDNPFVPQTVPGHLSTVIERPDGGPHLKIFSVAP